MLLGVQMENMSPEEQKSLSQLYMFLVQNPKHGALLWHVPVLFGVRVVFPPLLNRLLLLCAS